MPPLDWPLGQSVECFRLMIDMGKPSPTVQGATPGQVAPELYKKARCLFQLEIITLNEAIHSANLGLCSLDWSKIYIPFVLR